MTGPARDLFRRPPSPTGQPAPKGRPDCWRDDQTDDGKACALAYTPAMQQDLLRRSPGCAGCCAGINAAVLYYMFRKVKS